MKHTLTLSLGVALLSAGIGTAHAQRAPISREDRRAQRRQSMQNMTPEQRQQFFQNQRQQRNNARPGGGRGTGTNAFQGDNGTNGNGANGTGPNGTGNSRGGRGNRNGGTNGTAVSADAAHEARMRALMNAAGITDKAQQDPIVTFVLTQEKARQPLIKTAREVATSLRDGKSTPTQITAKWTTYQTALDTDKTRYKKDLAELDTKIGWSKDPRLESFLTLVGVITPDSLSLGGVQAIFVDAPATGTTQTPVTTASAPAAATPKTNIPPVNTPTASAPKPIPPGTMPMLVE